MREIKFRAWDIKRKRYMNDLTVIKVLPLALDKETSEGLLQVEQYTGLKDINGVDIYEGDILEDGSGDPIEYWTVKFEDGKFIGSTQGVDEDISELTDLEVIGNIHENPELLEEE